MGYQILQDTKHDLEKVIEGEVRLDLATRILYSTDASIYQVQPLGVIFPKKKQDLVPILEYCSNYKIPILPRGSGSSLAGQAVGEALVIDFSRYLNKVEEINTEEKTAWVQPGLVLSTFNQILGKHHLQFGPDPASADRATLGGMFGNNSTGAHSILYGMSADHLLEAEVVLSDGTQENLSLLSFEEINQISRGTSLKAQIIRAAMEIRSNYEDEIHNNWPTTWRNSSGYALNYLLPWTKTRPPRWIEENYPPKVNEKINFAPLVVGSEGSLVVFSSMKVNLVPVPSHKVLAVLSYSSIAEASDATPEILLSQPSAIELVPRAIISKARTIPAYAARLSFLEGDPAALLLVEYSGEQNKELIEKAKKLGSDTLVLEDEVKQKQLWEVRKVGLGLLMYMVGDAKPIPFIEDVAVPVEKLGEFVREFERVVASYGTQGDFYAHASAGCLHIRPIINLKTINGIEAMRGITSDIVDLILKFDGALSGEHGDGQARAEWLEKVYGSEIIEAFNKLKQAADPDGILNPGKVVNPVRMDENLRYGVNYQTKPWTSLQDFSDVNGLDGAIEMCNGAGVCRQSSGSMCPTFQATREEMHSTRGRANLLRELISGKQISLEDAEQAAFESLSLCLACKGCKAECPSAVDVAKLKTEFFNHYYQHRTHPLKDYLFGFIGEIARIGMPVAPLVNWFIKSKPGKAFLEKRFGISSNRTLPELKSTKTFNQDIVKRVDQVILLSDPFNQYFSPEILNQACKLLNELGLSVHSLPVVGTGRTKLSKGFIEAARKHSKKVIDTIEAVDRAGDMPIIVLEPSELSMIIDDFHSLFPMDDRVRSIASRTYSIEEFLLRPDTKGKLRIDLLDFNGAGISLLIHGHCHQKAQKPNQDGYPFGVEATVQLFKKIGCDVELIESGCCGMSGAFGYEKEHYDISKQVGELFLLPAVRAKKTEQVVIATGVSCRTQIENGSDFKAFHPVTILSDLLKENN